MSQYNKTLYCDIFPATRLRYGLYSWIQHLVHLFLDTDKMKTISSKTENHYQRERPSDDVDDDYCHMFKSSRRGEKGNLRKGGNHDWLQLSDCGRCEIKRERTVLYSITSPKLHLMMGSPFRAYIHT